MAIVIIEQDGMRRGTVLNGRTLIGRWASNGIVIEDENVSRVHAWITNQSDGFYVSDAQSRNGTRVNGRIIRASHQLTDGDEISVGPCRLIFRAAATLPEGLQPLHPPGMKPELNFPGPGLLFDCKCGAPLWAPSELSGLTRRCFYCSKKIIIPRRTGETARIAAEIPAATDSPATTGVTCSICQWSIDVGDATEKCPDCGLTFHSECWSENLGCSSYGCAQVNALAPKTEADAAVVDAHLDSDLALGAPNRTPWESVLLAGSFIAALLGALLFGAPALIMAAAVLVYFVRASETRRTGLLATAAVVSMVGVVAGVAASCWWWLDYWR